MIKVYKMNGKTEAHEVFASPSGKTVVKVTFAKGNLDPKNRVPAKYSTGNPLVQALIEADKRFNRTIFLDKVYGDFVSAAPSPAADATSKKTGKAKAAATKVSALTEMPDVKTIADAATVLIAEGAMASDIDGTVEGALKVAKTLGISFPNLKEEE